MTRLQFPRGEHINKLKLVHIWLYGHREEQIGVYLNHRNNLVLIEVPRLYLDEDGLPHFG